MPLQQRKFEEFIDEFDGAYRVFKGLIFKYEDVINQLDEHPSNDLFLALERIHEYLHRVQERSREE